MEAECVAIEPDTGEMRPKTIEEDRWKLDLRQN